LGPVELWDGAAQIALGRAKERSLLGVLALSSGRPVTVRMLIEALWDDSPPDNARKDLQIYVSRIRRYLRDAGASAEIATRQDTYVFHPHDDAVDHAQFKNLLKTGRSAHREKRFDEAAETLYQGVALWQGPPVSDLTTIWMEQKREELDSYDRFVGYRVLCDVELERGNYPEVLQLLDEVGEGYELDSSYIAQRLSALDGCGHYPDFDAYWQRIYRRNVQSFGTAPPRELQEFHSRLLQERDGFFPGVRFAAPDRPAQLPAPTSDFVGRQHDMERLESLLARSQIADATAPLIIALTGAAGTGKSELALQWAHTIKRQFPDGQLYADLSGYSRIEPAMPSAVIADLVKALGASPAVIPETLAARSALLRTVLDGKRVLIVLDDARDSSQVRPLLPASAHCVLLVSSRHRLTDLVMRNGAHRLVVQPLSTPASVTLLRRLLTAADVPVDKDSVDSLATLSGGLPHAVRIIAELAASGYAPQVADLLDVGEDEFHTIQAALSWSYQSLPTDAARLFRLLGGHPGPDFGLDLAAALADTTNARTRQNLTALSNISLIEQSGNRFSLHPLAQAVAARLLESTEPEEHRTTAPQRLLAWYLETLTAAAAALTATTGVFATSQDAIAWINTERDNLVAVVDLAGQRRWPQAWQLLRSLRPYIERETPPSDWVQVHTAVLAATRLSGDLEGQAATLIGLALVHRRLGNTQSELKHLEDALDICRSAKELRGQAESLLLLAGYHERNNDLVTAVELANTALTIHQIVDIPDLQADAHYWLGITHARKDDVDEATRNLNIAAEIYRDRNDQTGQTRTLTQLGLLARNGRHTETAISLLEDAVTLGTAEGMDPVHALPALVSLGESCCDDNQFTAAYTHARKAIGLCHPQHDFPQMVRALLVLVRALSAIGRHAEAVTEARKIVELVVDVPHPASTAALEQLAQLGLVSGSQHGI
jgi:tetratricopeptide (TPR) repeat protein